MRSWRTHCPHLAEFCSERYEGATSETQTDQTDQRVHIEGILTINVDGLRSYSINAMRLRTFLQLLSVFLAGSLAGILLLLLRLPGWLEKILGFFVTTITIGTMWSLRARNEKVTGEAP